MPRLLLLALVVFARPSLALENLTRGFRFDPPLLSIAEAPSDPNIVYVGTARGFVYVSHDGGKNWEELRLLTPRGQFFGSIRNGGSYFDLTGAGAPNLAPSFDFSPVDPNAPISDLLVGTPAVPLPTAPSGIAVGDVSGVFLGVFSENFAAGSILGSGAAGGGADASLGVGLSANAPRLGGAVRRKRGWGVGINLKQTLSLKSGAATAVRYLDVHPNDPNDVVAATADGLYQSRDGGQSWPLALTGASARERGINHLRRSPADPNLLYVGTGLGLHVSEDGGDTFDKLINPLVVNSDVQWISLHPTDPKTWFVGVTWGLLKTTDGGVNFSVMHRSPWPALGFVRRVLVDQRSPNVVYIGTADGPLRSADGGETFARVGGPQFIGMDVQVLLAGQRPGQIMVGGTRDLWVSDDGGENWQIRYFGAQWDLRAGLASLTPGEVWLITSAEVLRLGRDARQQVPRWLVDRYRQVVAKEPTVQQAVSAAIARAGVDVLQAGQALNRDRWGALLPQVFVYWRHTNVDVDVDRTLAVLDDPSLFTTGDYATQYWTAIARWDLLKLIHSRRETPATRIPRQVRTAEWKVRSTTIALYQERRRLRIASLAAADGDAERLLRNLRFEELTAHLNALTGDLFAPYSAL